MTSEYIISSLQKEKIIEYLASGKRLDGRGPLDYRDIKVEMNISKNAEASVRVKFGKTEVIAGVKIAVVAPYPDSPNAGTFMTTVELHPMASEHFEIGRPGIKSVELARVIDRGIRESGFIDFDKLCIKEGEKVWQVFLDIVAINDDGNMMDVAGLAGIIALGNAKMPLYNVEEDKLEGGLSKESLPINESVLSFNMTFHSIGGVIVCDVSEDEEAISEYRLSIAVGDNNGKPRITAMQKGKGGAINSNDMEKILKLVEDKYKSMFPKIRKYVFGK
ncbi:MAG: exosome complex protein Rrp42 [Nanoarchaeota archaeon]|nr:exosome complex protein Rrp42 [Nanoarchaeota archaeon]